MSCFQGHGEESGRDGKVLRDLSKCYSAFGRHADTTRRDEPNPTDPAGEASSRDEGN